MQTATIEKELNKYIGKQVIIYQNWEEELDQIPAIRIKGKLDLIDDHWYIGNQEDCGIYFKGHSVYEMDFPIYSEARIYLR
jgi:hypothetical protein